MEHNGKRWFKLEFKGARWLILQTYNQILYENTFLSSPKNIRFRGGTVGRDFAISSSISIDSCQWRYYVPTDDFDSDSSTAMAPSTPVSSRPSNTTDLDTDLLETFSLYDEREGHYTLHSRNQSFNISMDFSSEDLSHKAKKSKITIRTNPFDRKKGNTSGRLSSDVEHRRNEQRARKSSDTKIKVNQRLSLDSSLHDLGRNSSEYETHLWKTSRYSFRLCCVLYSATDVILMIFMLILN